MHDGFVAPVDGTRRIEHGLPLAELFALTPPDVPQRDDALLDAWLGSLTPDRFGRILDSLARLPVTSVAAAG